MSVFAPIVDATASLSLIAPSSPVPLPGRGSAPRFAREPVRWVAVGNSANVYAFARSAVRLFTGSSAGIPGNAASSWTLLELSPLPAFAASVLLALPGGLPVAYVLLSPDASTGVTDNQAVGSGDVIAKAATSAGSSVWFGVCLQDRVVRDPALWSSEIAQALNAAGADPGSWTAFATALAGLGTPGQIYILDHVGRPFQPQLPTPPQNFTVSTNSGATAVSLGSDSDGNTGLSLPASGIAFDSASHALLAGVEVEGGAFDSAFTLPPGVRHVQVADADLWFAERDNLGITTLARWNPNSFLEPIADGNPYYARLVADLKLTIGGGGAGFAGWAFVQESLLDKTQKWPLIPGQSDTEFVKLVTTLADQNSTIRLLVNQFLQFEVGSFDDSTAVLAILWALFAANFPIAAFGAMTTDPAGFGVLFGAIAVADFLIASPVTLDILRAVGEVSTSTVNDLKAYSLDLVRWSPYPAETTDNPLFTPPLVLAGITVDDIKHFGVYHQKFVVGKTGAGEFFGYLGGIDINSNRVDSPLHRAMFPYHDVQARLTGPALKDLIQSFAERTVYDQGTMPFAVPDVPPPVPSNQPPGTHLVQIGRTYYRPKTSAGFHFAPNGETVTHRTNLKAIAAARDFIYIEEQYFTPDNEYIDALCAAADRAQALVITLCMQNGQTFGPIRRTDVLTKLAAVWGQKLKVGALVRRFLNPTPAKTVNLGRCVLAADIDANSPTISIGPKSHVPEPPFWVFVENELMQVTASQADNDPSNRTLFVNRGPLGLVATWGAKVDKHDKGSAVMCVRVPNIYVHAKLMIIDDVFLSVGSANLNRRGHFHDGEINAITMPQHLKRDPVNPARRLRCQLWGEHLGLTPEMGLSLLSDPLSALPYFDRPWFAGNRWQPLNWSGDQPDDLLGFSSADSFAMELLNLAVGAATDAYKPLLWPALVDPTSTSDLNAGIPGPEYP